MEAPNSSISVLSQRTLGPGIDLTGPDPPAEPAVASTTGPVLHPPPETITNRRKRRHKIDEHERHLICRRYIENPGEGQLGVV